MTTPVTNYGHQSMYARPQGVRGGRADRVVWFL